MSKNINIKFTAEELESIIFALNRKIIADKEILRGLTDQASTKPIFEEQIKRNTKLLTRLTDES